MKKDSTMKSSNESSSRWYKPPRHSWGFAYVMLKEARHYRMWIVFRRKWYSPDEFERYIKSDECKNYDGTFEFDTEDLKLKNPIPLLNKMREEIEKKQKGLTEFAIRIAESYRGDPPEK